MMPGHLHTHGQTELEAKAWPVMWNEEVQLLLVKFDLTARKRLAGVLTFEAQEDTTQPKPTATLSRSAAQTLMDMLWDCGLRPTATRQADSTLGAVERHLADMRSLAFAKILKTPPPKL